VREQIDKLESELRSLLGGSVASSANAASATLTPTGRKRRTMSAAARAKLSAAAKKRWAKVHASQKKK
jgi:hypothetical protein